MGINTRINAGQNALSTTAELLVAANPERNGVRIHNTDGAIVIYIGEAGVTSANGCPIAAGSFIDIGGNAGPIYAVAASGTPTAAFVEW